MNIPNLSGLVQATSTGVLVGGLLALIALGLSLVLGVMRLVNLVHGEFVTVGSYLAAMLLTGWGLDPLWCLPLVALGTAALAYPVQRLLLQPLHRHGPDAPLLTTFALSIIAQNVITLVFGGATRSIDRPYTRWRLVIGPVTVPTIYLFTFAVSAVALAGVHLLIARTAFGRRLRAASEDPDAAAVLGVRVSRTHASTYALGGAVAGLAGGLVGMAFSFTPTAGTGYLLTGFAVVVLGGLGSVAGTAVGGLLLGVAESWGALLFGDGYRVLVGLLVFIVLLALRPQGLFGRAAL